MTDRTPDRALEALPGNRGVDRWSVVMGADTESGAWKAVLRTAEPETILTESTECLRVSSALTKATVWVIEENAKRLSAPVA